MTFDWINEQLLFLISSGQPSVEELARGVGLRAKSSVHDRLRALKAEGLITWEEKVHRSYRLTELGIRYVKANYGEDQNIPESEPFVGR